MKKKTFSFPAQGGIIPNIPNPENPSGEFHAGQEVDVDLDTMTVLTIILSFDEPKLGHQTNRQIGQK